MSGMTIDLAKVHNEAESGPDAQHLIPGGCSCGGEVQWHVVMQWRNYPDGSLVFVECQDCGAGGELTL